MDDLSVTEETWETIRDKIPDDDLRWGIYFENGCWTFFHDPRNITTIIPLRIAGAPVVVPIYSPPFIHPGTVSPSDPCPKLINPYHEIPDNVVVNLLESFPFALAFYILYNGFCQIWVDEDFDFELAASHLPREFGGLKVTYFTHGPSETSSRSHVQTTVVEGGSHEPNAGRAAAHREISITPTIGCGSEIDVISAILSKSVGRALRSRIGVKILTESDSVEVITMSSHAAFAPRIYKTLARKHLKLGFLSRGWNRLSGRVENEPVQTLDQPQVTADTTERWWESVEIFAAGSDKKIGNIHKTYDENASEDTSYPIGFQHDISLVKPDTDSMRMLSGMKCPAREWYRDAAIDTRSRLYVLGSHQIDGQGLPKYWAEPVGKGIMVNQNTFPTEKRWKEGDIKQLIGRCTLWRPLNASSGWNGWSGAPVIVNKEDGTEELLGFQSFVQDSHHRQFAMPDRRLKMDCANGYISFGACMKLPQEILSSTIL
ncbi:hypothetical protein BDD12DRAFT_806750 [Trichophaea hybrida]|nr:hypothetical protein BDD12DRAFT_806750 [Trichophaea hybrida]